MKKLLLIFTIMLTFSITTVSVSAAEEFNPSTEITNLFADFKTDTDSNGIADNWEHRNSTNGTLVDEVQKVYSNGSTTIFGIGESEIQLVSGHIYYASYHINTNASNFNSYVRYTNTSITNVDFALASNSDGKVYGNIEAAVTNNDSGIRLYVQEISAALFDASIYVEFKDVMLIDLTAAYGAGLEPAADEFEALLKVDHFSSTVIADQVLSFDNNTRVDHYLYEAPDIFEDFPNNITMENMIRIAFFIPLMIIFYLAIPLFNFVLGGSATGFVLLSLLILAFILREVIRFIDPDFHLFGKNSYYDGYKSPKGKD